MGATEQENCVQKQGFDRDLDIAARNKGLGFRWGNISAQRQPVVKV